MSLDLYIDSTLNGLEEIRFRKSNRELIWKLAKETHFTRAEVEILLILYYKFRKGRKHVVTRDNLEDLLCYGFDMTDPELTNRMIMSRCRGPNPKVSMTDWVKIFDTLLKGTQEEKMVHCFQVYDTMNTGKIDRNTILGLLDNAIVSEDEAEDLLKDLSDLIMKKMDYDRCGKISPDDYRKGCTQAPLMLEFLGQCLPSRLAIATFLNTVKKKVKKNI